MAASKGVLGQRCAGVLLHPTSLPGAAPLGSIGPEAYRFVDFLKASGMRVWQMLPLTPTHGDLSPYQGLSVHAGNPYLISLDLLVEAGWLDAVADDISEVQDQRLFLRQAYDGFKKNADAEAQAELVVFVEAQAHWLEDYALFLALRETHSHCHWLAWPDELRDRQSQALVQARIDLSDMIAYYRFEQFLFFSQWAQLRSYAADKGVLLFGDMPIFVAHDSAEVWAHREYFLLDESGQATTVAGVPPDYFSETGQRWGNPHYNWQRMAEDDYKWWKTRFSTQLQLFDWIRIDHFRGFEAYWEIPAEEETAINGCWVEGPGAALFNSLENEFGELPLVAEDLGIITDAVDALRREFSMPGMKILQFAFDSDSANPYLPHNHTQDSVVYTGTHDNDTTLGWYNTLSEEVKERLAEYQGYPSESMPWPLIRTTFESVADIAIVPMQDILALDGEHRMNTPGTVDGNWRWRFDWGQVPESLAENLATMNRLYGR